MAGSQSAIMPPAAAVASRPGSPFSTTSTRAPVLRSRQASERPITPPPMIATSQVFTLSILLETSHLTWFWQQMQPPGSSWKLVKFYRDGRRRNKPIRDRPSKMIPPQNTWQRWSGRRHSLLGQQAQEGADQAEEHQQEQQRYRRVGGLPTLAKEVVDASFAVHGMNSLRSDRRTRAGPRESKRRTFVGDLAVITASRVGVSSSPAEPTRIPQHRRGFCQ